MLYFIRVIAIIRDCMIISVVAGLIYLKIVKAWEAAFRKTSRYPGEFERILLCGTCRIS